MEYWVNFQSHSEMEIVKGHREHRTERSRTRLFGPQCPCQTQCPCLLIYFNWSPWTARESYLQYVFISKQRWLILQYQHTASSNPSMQWAVAEWDLRQYTHCTWVHTLVHNLVHTVAQYTLWCSTHTVQYIFSDVHTPCSTLTFTFRGWIKGVSHQIYNVQEEQQHPPSFISNHVFSERPWPGHRL